AGGERGLAGGHQLLGTAVDRRRRRAPDDPERHRSGDRLGAADRHSAGGGDGCRADLHRRGSSRRAALRRGAVPRDARIPEHRPAPAGALGRALGRRRRPAARQGHEVPAARGEVLMTADPTGTMSARPAAASAPAVDDRLRRGAVIPAHPLALDATGAIDERAQRALTRYYLDAGVDGLAVGVHTTQFELHDDLSMLADVWAMAAAERDRAGTDPLLVAGLVGDTDQAVAEAEVAREAGYQVALL